MVNLSNLSQRLLAKLIVTVFASFVLFGATILLLFNNTILFQFTELEEEHVNNNIIRVKEALQNEVQSLHDRVKDWAYWDDSYSFVEKPYEDYVQVNLTYDSLIPLNFTHILFINKKLQLVYSAVVDLDKEKVVKANKSVTKILIDSEVFKTTIKNRDGAGGFIVINNKIYLVAAAPIFDSELRNEPGGVLVFTRELTQEYASRVAQQTNLELIVQKINNDRTLGYDKGVTFIIDTKFSMTNISSHGEYVSGETTLHDIFGNPILKFSFRQPRNIYKKGLEVRTFLAICFSGMALLTAFLIVILVNKLVVGRVAEIGRQLMNIAKSDNFTGRIDNLDRKDEIGVLASNINNALAALDHANQQTLRAQSLTDQANRAKSIFIARVSHELRNPIGGVIGLNRLIKQQVSSKAVQKLINMSDEAANSCLSVINEILDFSKAESGELTFEKIEFSPRDLVRETMDIMSARTEAKYENDAVNRIELLASVSKQVPLSVIGDPTKIKQVLINLLSNSIKFTAHGHVRLILDFDNNDKGAVVFKIQDTGIGIPADKIESVFKPYKQADESVAREYHGTGLGLSIVKQFVEGMGGEIGVDSKVGEGSTFWFKLPLDFVKTKAELKFNTNTCHVLHANEYYCRYLIDDLRQLGLGVTALDSQKLVGDYQSLQNVNFLIVTEGSLSNADLKKSVLARQAELGLTTTFILKPSSVELRDELYQVGFERVYITPVIADDLVVEPNSTQPVVTEASNVTKPSRQLNILIADDLPTNRLILKHFLIEEGHKVVEVDDGQLLLDRISPQIAGGSAEQPFDMIITDITMPKLDGDAASRKIRELEQLAGAKQHLPIVAVTGHAFKEEVDKIYSSGVDGVLVKPITPEKLKEELHRLIERSN